MDLKFCKNIKDHHISNEYEGQGPGSKVKLTKVKHVKVAVFSLVSENIIRSQTSRVKVIVQGQRSKIKFTRAKVKGSFATHRFPGGMTRRRFHMKSFWGIIKIMLYLKDPHTMHTEKRLQTIKTIPLEVL